MPLGELLKDTGFEEFEGDADSWCRHLGLINKNGHLSVFGGHCRQALKVKVQQESLNADEQAVLRALTKAANTPFSHPAGTHPTKIHP